MLRTVQHGTELVGQHGAGLVKMEVVDFRQDFLRFSNGTDPHQARSVMNEYVRTARPPGWTEDEAEVEFDQWVRDLRLEERVRERVDRVGGNPDVVWCSTCVSRVWRLHEEVLNHLERGISWCTNTTKMSDGSPLNRALKWTYGPDSFIVRGYCGQCHPGMARDWAWFNNVEKARTEAAVAYVMSA